LCDTFAKLNKLNISMQGPDKNMLDASDKIVVFVKKLPLQKEDTTILSEGSQWFTFFWTNIQIKQNFKFVFTCFQQLYMESFDNTCLC